MGNILTKVVLTAKEELDNVINKINLLIDENKKLIEDNEAAKQTDLDKLSSQMDDMVRKIEIDLADFGGEAIYGFDNTSAFNNAINFIKENRYNSAKIKLGDGRWEVHGTVNCVIPPYSTSLTDSCTLIIEGGSGSTQIIKKGNGILFNMQYGNHYYKNLVCIAENDVTELSTAFSIGKNETDSIEGVVSGCYFENVKTFRFNKHFNIKRMFDSQFTNCGAYVINGANGYGLGFDGHTYDNTNNISFYRCHFEGTNDVTQRLLKIDGENLIPEINFFGCHFENNGSKNCVNIEIRNGQSVNFNGCQIANNGWDDVSTNIVIIDNSIVEFNNCLFGKKMSNSPKAFSITGKSSVYINGGYLYIPEEGGLIDIYEKNYDSVFRTHNLVFRDISFDPNTNEIEINSEVSNNKRFSFKVNNEGNLNIRRKSIVRSNTTEGGLDITSLGKIKPTLGYSCKDAKLESGSSEMFILFETNKNSRGTFVLQTDINGNGAIILFTNGSQLFNVTNNDLYSINSILEGKIGVTVVSGKIKITNNTTDTRRFSIIPFQFGDI